MSKPHEPKTLCKSSRTETAPQMPSPERSKITHSHEPKLDETTEERESEGDHLIVNPDFFVNATNRLESTNGAVWRERGRGRQTGLTTACGSESVEQSGVAN